MKNVREYIKENVLLFDGSMGTYFTEKNRQIGMSCEMANINQPELISEIHKEYLKAGAKAIKTNTFAVNRVALMGNEELVQKTIKAAWDIAQEAVKGYDAYIFASIGPISNLPDNMNEFEEYKFVVDQFIALGTSNFLFETNSNLQGLKEIAAYIKETVPDAYIINSFAVQADGYTRDGLWITEILDEVKACEAVDAMGMNCVCGPRHMLELLSQIDFEGTTLSMMPNAGYPTVISNRTVYEGDPLYYASQLKIMAAEGVKILGGCCGTMPLHIEKVKAELGSGASVSVYESDEDAKDYSEDIFESPFWKKLQEGEKVIAVELDSPADVTMTKFMSGAWELKGAGTDIITIADCPIARARMDSSILACKLSRELNIDVLPHLTCRDRNLNATKALLLGLYAEGIRNVLLVTGDPIPAAERDEVKNVYQFNSRKLAGFVNTLGKKQLPSPFHMFGALNVNAYSFDAQLKFAKEKLEKGMIGFLTQPVLSEKAFENLKRARKELDGYILGGVIPVVSAKNARFMDSEINGINVDPKITEMYEGKDRAEGETLATEISVEIMKQIEPYVDGFYMMTPFGRTGLIARILEEYRK